MIRKPKTDRRKVNQPVGDDRRGTKADRRQCPQCKSILSQGIKSFPGGTWTMTYCTKCNYQVKTKQVDEDHLQALLGFEGMIVGTHKKPLLELNHKMLDFAGLKPGDSIEVKPLYTPGARQTVVWVLKKIK
jgi:hypothetical protein